MSRLLSLFTCACVGLLLMAPSSATAVVWQQQYEGNVLPDAAAPAFSLQNNSSGSSTTLQPGGFVNVSGGGGSWYQWDMNSTWSVPVSGSTVEIRLAVPSVNGTYGTSVQFIDDASDRLWFFTWNANNVFLNNFAQGQADFDTSTFNTYRFTFVGNTATMYLNNDPTPRLSGTGIFQDGITNFSIGKMNAQVGGTGSYDYIYWTTAGAFAPEAVPEPSSATLLIGIAMLSLRGLRKKK